MSRDEAKDMPLRELTRELVNSLEAHKKESAEFRLTMAETMAEIKTHAFYSKEKVDSHEKSIKKLNTSKDIQTGFLAALSAIGLTFIVDLIKRLSQ